MALGLEPMSVMLDLWSEVNNMNQSATQVPQTHEKKGGVRNDEE